MKRLALLFTAFAAIAMAGTADEGKKTDAGIYRLQWRDLGRLAGGHRVNLALPSGIKLEGTVVAAEPDDLVLDVRKTSDKFAYPKGRAVIPRAEVARLRVFTRGSRPWRAIGTAIGAGIGVPLAIGAAALSGNVGTSRAWVPVAGAVPTGLGFLLGWAADRGHYLDVEIEPPVPAR